MIAEIAMGVARGLEAFFHLLRVDFHSDEEHEENETKISYEGEGGDGPSGEEGVGPIHNHIQMAER